LSTLPIAAVPVPRFDAEAMPGAARAPRIASIDALRGLVILLMLVDHTREFFYLHAQVGDPMDLATTPPALFFTRLAAHLCAPVFVALTGIAAWLYANPRGGAPAAAAFLAATYAEAAAGRITYDTQQFHGAAGLTREIELHFFTYRLRSLQGELAGVAGSAARAADQLWPRREARPVEKHLVA